MGFIQLLTSLWPFLKEMFVGDKIKDSSPSKDGRAGKAQNEKEEQPGPSNTALWCLNKMQKSRRFLAAVLIVLILSLFVNYKVIGKLSALVPPAVVPRDEDHNRDDDPSPVVPKTLPTVPRSDGSERDVLLEQTVRELKVLYGVSR